MSSLHQWRGRHWSLEAEGSKEKTLNERTNAKKVGRRPRLLSFHQCRGEEDLESCYYIGAVGRKKYNVVFTSVGGAGNYLS